jgi:thiamine biosynthesis lipoprotein
MNRARRLFLLATCLAAAVPARPQQAPPSDGRATVSFSGPAFGSRHDVRVVMRPGDDAANERIRAAIARELALAERLFSRWNASSEISLLSAHASTEPFPVSRETLAAFALARRASELSGGALDATVAPLVDAWGFGPSRAERSVPDDATIAALRARVDYRLLELDATRSSVTKRRPDVACDLSALGDGWAADRIAAALVGLGYRDLLVDVAGEVTARGRRADGGPWRVGVEWPGRPREQADVIELVDAAVATSGDYKKAWVDAHGRRYSHILDPRTGRPVAHDLVSVTVVDQGGAWADALATALLVLGPDAGRALAMRERLVVRFVNRERDGSYTEWATPAFEGILAAIPARGAGTSHR